MYKHHLLRLPLSDEELLLYAPTLGKVWRIQKQRDPGMAYVESKIPVELSKSHVDITYLISFKCNLQCVYCYQAHDGEYGVLGVPDAKSIATKLLNLHLDDANRFVGNFFGGKLISVLVKKEVKFFVIH